MLLAKRHPVERDSKDSLQIQLQELKQQLRARTRELHRKEEELQHLFYMISHELRTPISAIRGFASILLENGSELQAESADYLRRIHKNVDRLEKIVNDLGLLSRLNINENSFEVINLQELISDILIGSYDQIRSGQVTVSIQPDLPPAYGYREGLHHVFSNLILNAIKYRKRSQPVKIDIGCLQDEFFLKYYVRDNGIGIPSAYRKSIFDMFVRAGNVKKVNGSGLGLYIVRRVIQAHGGEIWVESRVGRGATFYFTLAKVP